jgi:2-methylisocitrate lyase-like PEP mutase family enzyme
MVMKVAVACEARQRPESMLVIARTDARQGEGLDQAIRRARAYAEAGADAIFVEALESIEEMKQVCGAIERPLLINMADGGRTPILPQAILAELGFALAIFPARAALAAAAAVDGALRALRGGDAAAPPLFSFDEMCRLVGFEDVWAFERKWGPASGSR